MLCITEYAPPGIAKMNDSTITSISQHYDVSTYAKNDIYSQREHNKDSLWNNIMDTLNIIFLGTGTVSNLMTYIVFVQQGKHLSPLISIIFRHQTIIDGFICAQALPMLLIPYLWTTGVYALDVIICHLYHSANLYWFCVTISILNLCLLSFERLLAVSYPLIHHRFTKTKLYSLIALIYIFEVLYKFPDIMIVHFTNNQCIKEWYFYNLSGLEMYNIWRKKLWFLVGYLLPLLMFIICYSKILFTLHSRQKDTSLGSSSTINQATNQLTKTSILVVGAFILTMSYGAWLYFFWFLDIIDFTPKLQKVSVLLTTINSAVNPAIYTYTMPVFREGIKHLFHCWKNK